MSKQNKLPEWIYYPKELAVQSDPVPTLDDVNDLIMEINYLRGMVMGFEAKVNELEEKFDMALDYQREVDARLVDSFVTMKHVKSDGETVFRYDVPMKHLGTWIRENGG